jgi:hypothetical protein
VSTHDRSSGTGEPERTPGPDREPSGVLGGQPINADESAPRDALPEPSDDAGLERDPDAVEDEPGQDL